MTLKRASFGNNVTVIRACIQSDLIYLLTITVTLGERSYSVFIFKTFGMSSKLRVCAMYLSFWTWVLFFEQANISDVFEIVSRVDDKL